MPLTQALGGPTGTGGHENGDPVGNASEEKFRVESAEEKGNISVPRPGRSVTLNWA